MNDSDKWTCSYCKKKYELELSDAERSLTYCSLGCERKANRKYIILKIGRWELILQRY